MISLSGGQITHSYTDGIGDYSYLTPFGVGTNNYNGVKLE